MLWPFVHSSWPVVDSNCVIDVPVEKVIGCFCSQTVFCSFLGLYQALWFPLSFQLVRRCLAILDLNLFDLLNLVRMIDRKMNINAESNDDIRFIVNDLSVFPLFCWSSLRTVKLRNVLQLDIKY